MLVPISWLKDFVDITIPIDELARRLTMAGLEVENITYIGLPMPESHGNLEVKVCGLTWEADKIVTASVSEVLPHPNADRLVLCKLFDGIQEHIVLTGAPNLFPYKGIGALAKPLKVAYAKEGARIYDGHQAGQALTTLKRTKIRGVESYSMICSEKELGISEDHEGVIILDEDAPVSVPLAEYMGDAVLDISILPNIARAASILGVAREVAALTGQELRQPSYTFEAKGPSIEGKAFMQITEPALNPRFVLGLIQDVEIKPSPYWLQRRLKLAGMRPINNIVDATNYAMLEIGEPLHAFDYDVLVQRAQGKAPTIITRRAKPGERLTTLDGVERPLDEFTVLVCDTAGGLSIAGVMGGAESEVYDASQETLDATGIPLDEEAPQLGKASARGKSTINILLEGAAWNFINIRKTVAAQKLLSEAAYRFSRGVHPAVAERGVSRCLELMRQLAGGVICQGLVDNYPLPPHDPTVEVSEGDVQRVLGISLSAEQIADLLRGLEFGVEVQGDTVRATAPDHRLDIGEGQAGKADLLEEVARIYGYERIPETRLRDELPHQRNNPALEGEERLRDLLVGVGLQEIVSHRLTTPEREARRRIPGMPDERPYLTLANPISSDRTVLRHSLLSFLLETVERNARLRERMALFEIGPVFLVEEGQELPRELQRLGIILTGPRSLPGWQPADTQAMDFFDLKGLLAVLLDALHIPALRYEPAENPSLHPGKCARILSGEQEIGVFGELHPLVCEQYDLPPTPLLAAGIDLELLLPLILEQYETRPVPAYPPALEDLALVVDEDIAAEQVAESIRNAGGKLVANVRLFDIYRSEQIGQGKKSLAYSITYQAPDKTLSDKDLAGIRQRILRRLEQEVKAQLRR
ncbi:MAG: phenylalanine--tRNA ligase subunit beta [Anaerolineales bacterium]|nr:phenylalanine--tRNA ligase subunit beta [Anaerolineales bacterium]